ncbi:vertebrate ancient opsin-like [Anopheles merus]|uniref:G-protein coupled receptors family 1 profile domain-containing protein n=2 Tax=gambiae species complex TaxID=44542 RepID=A0A182VLM0_ANOME|nr:vertebrate ancient opsin-like [Anopheles merus]XP_041765173.1 vertebrate ancient opsin-like [Anopheles merus]
MNDAPNDVAASAVDYEDLMAPWAYNASAVTLFFIGFFGFFLNLFVIALMCKDMQLWTPMNIILFNLVCSDFSVSIIGNPLTLTSAISHRWIFGRTLCVAYGFFMSLLGITSITTLTVLSYERYCLISRPFSSRNLTRRGAFLAIFFIWGYSFALTSPPLFGWGAYVQEAANISCSVNWESQTKNATTYIIFLFVFGLVVPLIVIVYSYTNIIVNMRENSARVGRINRAEQRVTSMVAVMIVAFMVAWTPYAIFALIEQFGPPELIGPGLAVLPALVAKSSICYNPIIYVGMNTQFRAAFSRVRNKGQQAADQNTTTMQRELTKSSRDMVECSFDFCRKKSRFKISLVKPTAPLAVVDVSSTSHRDKGTSRSPLDQTVLNETNEDVGRERSGGGGGGGGGAYAGTRFVRPDFELSVINSGKSILIKSKNFRSNLL